MGVSRETPDATTKQTCYALTNILTYLYEQPRDRHPLDASVRRASAGCPTPSRPAELAASASPLSSRRVAHKGLSWQADMGAWERAADSRTRAMKACMNARFLKPSHESGNAGARPKHISIL